ncbi:hypothetical protein GCM10009846_08980 [Agrococcus versicolor]|uniref:Glycosyl transferase n=1 Tax=Agrococcus versicolor TaxID=501482 RepID=A0ABP5MF64_9MICO
MDEPDASASDASSPLRIAIVVPSHDADVLDVLVPELLGTAEGAELDVEVLVVPAAADVAVAAADHAATDARIEVVPVAPGVEGATAFADALRVAASRADVVAVLGGHGRNDPAELPTLLARLDTGDVDVVVGDGLAASAAPGFVVLHADVVHVVADRVDGGIARIPIVATSLGLAVATVPIDDRDARTIDDVVDGWHAWHDRVVLAVLDRRVLRIVAAAGALAVVAAITLALALVVPWIVGLSVLPGMLVAMTLALVGSLVLVVALATDALRAAVRERPHRAP